MAYCQHQVSLRDFIQPDAVRACTTEIYKLDSQLANDITSDYITLLCVYTLTSLIRNPQNRAFLSTGHHLLVNFLLTSSKTHVANLLTHHIVAEGQ